MRKTCTLPSPQRDYSRDDLVAIRKSIEVAKEAFEAASDALKLLVSMESELLVRSHGLEGELDFYELVQEFESNMIRQALNQANGIQVRAARLLNIKPTTLNSKIKLYNIEKDVRFIAEAARPTETRSLKKPRKTLVA